MCSRVCVMPHYSVAGSVLCCGDCGACLSVVLQVDTFDMAMMSMDRFLCTSMLRSLMLVSLGCVDGMMLALADNNHAQHLQA